MRISRGLLDMISESRLHFFQPSDMVGCARAEPLSLRIYYCNKFKVA